MNNLWLSWCLQTLTQSWLIETARHAFGLLAGGLVWLSLVNAVLHLVFSLYRTARQSHWKKTSRLPIPPAVIALLAKIDVPTDTFCLVEGEEPELYCLDFQQPLIVASTGLLSLLTLSELEAALRHEAGHLSHHHGLKLLLMETASKALWFLPTGKELVRYYRYRYEIEADREAGGGDNQSLRSALHKLLSTPKPAWQLAFAGSPAEARVETLLTGKVRRFHPSRFGIRQSVLAVLFTAVVGILFCLTHQQAHAAVLVKSPNYCIRPLFSPNLEV